MKRAADESDIAAKRPRRSEEQRDPPFRNSAWAPGLNPYCDFSVTTPTEAPAYAGHNPSFNASYPTSHVCSPLAPFAPGFNASRNPNLGNVSCDIPSAPSSASSFAITTPDEERMMIDTPGIAPEYLQPEYLQAPGESYLQAPGESYCTPAPPPSPVRARAHTIPMNWPSHPLQHPLKEPKPLSYPPRPAVTPLQPPRV